MFNFKKVTIQNFKSIQQATIDLQNRGLVLIEGINTTNATFQANGAGKSTIFEAITWALYDTTQSGVTADKVVNKEVGKDTIVTLDFEVNNMPYQINRYRKHKKFKNTVTLFQDDLNLTQKSVKDTNKKILDLFGVDYKTYLNSIAYGQGDVELFSTASDKGKKEILENVTNIAIYKKAQDVAKEKVKELNQKEASIAFTIREQETAIQHTVELDTQQKEAKKREQQQYKELQKQEETRLKELKKAQEVQEKQVQLEEQKVNALQGQLAQIEKPSNAVDTSDLDSKKAKLVDQVNRLQQAKYQVDGKVGNLRSDLSRLDTSDTCYACGAKIDNNHKLVESERIKEEITSCQSKSKQCQDALDVLEPQVQLLAQEAENRNKSYMEQLRKYSAVQSELTTQEYKVEQAKNNSTVNSLVSIIENLRNQIQQFVFLSEQVDYKAKMKELEKTLKQSKEEQQRIRDDIQVYTTIVKDVFSNKGIRSVVLDLVTPFLNEKANGYLATLAGSDISITFSTQKELASGELKDSFDISVENSSGGSEYNTNSAGEKKRIDLAIALAIQDLVMSQSNLKTNIALYDECFDGLDAIGCENVIKILNEKQKEIGSVFVITHNENLKSFFDNIITVKKEKGVSIVTGGES